jgi:hypothetical protein
VISFACLIGSFRALHREFLLAARLHQGFHWPLYVRHRKMVVALGLDEIIIRMNGQ